MWLIAGTEMLCLQQVAQDEGRMELVAEAEAALSSRLDNG